MNDRYVDIPAWTTILGAAKVVGRTRSGWTLGVLEAVTGREYAQLSDGARTVKAEVEPLSSYTVFRAQREIGRRGAVGVLGTSVFRDLNEPALRSYLTDRAVMIGVDGHVFLDRARNWVFHGGLAGSSVHGSTDAITRLQKAEQRYYQRPDVTFVKLDPAATSMSGWNGQANVNRNSGNVTVNLGIWGMSPGLEVNDAGYSTQTDRAGAHALLQYRKLTPDRWSSERIFWVSKWWTWNWGWQSQGDGWQANATIRLRNMWRTSAQFTYARRVWDDKLTRGGPTVIRPGNRGVQLALVTDPRKKAVVSLGGSYTDREYGASALVLDAQLAWRPFPALTLTAGPAFRRNIVSAQYLATVPDPYATRTYSNRYVFGDLGQTEVSATTRVSLATSPRTSLQIYLQPLISAGDYGAIKEVYAPNTYDFVRYGIDAGTITASGSRFVIDPDAAGPASSFTIAQPDFNVTSLRVNAVFRWEFRPGSSFFVVWTQQRRDRLPTGDFDFSSGFSRVYTSPADDVFLVKVSYWFGARR